MNEKQTQALIQKEIQAKLVGSRFGLNAIPRHVHNNIDSPYTFQPILSYGGIVQSDGLGIYLPNGWTSTVDGSGFYTITHNLGSLLYIVTASCLQSTNFYGAPVITPDVNSMTISFGGGFLGDVSFSRQITDFYFILLVTNNKNNQIPLYSLSNLFGI